jgi:hypothetical protein
MPTAGANIVIYGEGNRYYTGLYRISGKNAVLPTVVRDKKGIATDARDASASCFPSA